MLDYLTPNMISDANEMMLKCALNVLSSALLHLHGQRLCIQADQQLYELFCAWRSQGYTTVFKTFINMLNIM